MVEARAHTGRAAGRREQRFPLLVGLRAFRLLTVWPAWAMLAIAASQVAWLVAPDLAWGKPLRMLGFTGLALALGAAILPWVMLPALWKGASSLRRAIAVRACDVVLGPEGLRVEGGPAHGFTATWTSLAPPAGMRRANGALVLRGEGGKWLELPLPPDEDERASLEALAATIGARASAGLAPAPRREPAGLLRCPGCGAVLPPADAAEIACRHCAARVAMPAEIVAKVRAAAAVSASKRGEERLVASLVAGLGARAANAVVFAGGLALAALATLTVLVGAALAFVDGREAGVPRVEGLGFAAAGVCLALLGLVHRLLADRRALRLLTVGFAAIEPLREGDPLTCRACGAPLGDPGDSAVCRCVYCGATNVAVVDLRLEAAVIERFGARAPEPAAVLAACRARRRRAGAMGAAGLAAIALGLASLHTTPIPAAHAVEIPFRPAAVAPKDARVLPSTRARSVTRVAVLGDARAELVAREDGLVDAYLAGDPPRVVRRVGDGPARAEPSDLPAGARFVTPLPDGSLVFVTPEGLRVRAQGGRVSPFAAPGALVDPIVLDAAAGPDGSLLVTTRASSEGHLRVRRVPPGGVGTIVLEDAMSPAPSLGGDRLAASRFVGERFQLVASRAPALGAVEQLTRGKGHAAFPVWSPDGKRLAFLTRPVRDAIQFSKYEGETSLWLLDLDGHADELTHGAPLDLARPVWTAEGIWVTARQREGSAWVTTVWRVVPG